MIRLGSLWPMEQSLLRLPMPFERTQPWVLWPPMAIRGRWDRVEVVWNWLPPVGSVGAVRVTLFVPVLAIATGVEWTVSLAMLLLKPCSSYFSDRECSLSCCVEDDETFVFARDKECRCFCWLFSYLGVKGVKRSSFCFEMLRLPVAVLLLLLLQLFSSIVEIRSFECYFSSLPYEIADDLTLSNVPSLLNNQLVEASGSCAVTVEWLRNPRSTLLTFGFTSEVSPESVSASVHYQLAGEVFLQRLSRKMEYRCRAVDGCNNEANLRRLLRSLDLKETFSPQFDGLLSSIPSFSKRCNEERTSPEKCPPRDDLNCQRCEIIADWRDPSRSEICATCPTLSSDVNSLDRKKVFLFANRSLSIDHLQLWCQTGEQCNTLEIVQLLRQSSTINLDFDKFFQSSSSVCLFLVAASPRSFSPCSSPNENSILIRRNKQRISRRNTSVRRANLLLLLVGTIGSARQIVPRWPSDGEKRFISAGIARRERERDLSKRILRETTETKKEKSVNRYLCIWICPRVVAFDNWIRAPASFERSLSKHIQRIDWWSMFPRCPACESDVSGWYSTRRSWSPNNVHPV